MILGRCLFFNSTRLLSEFTKISNNNYRRVVHAQLPANAYQLQRCRKLIVRMASTSHGDTKDKKNKLALEKSSYLLQHASNPVDWYPWSDEALEKAKREDKLIFLSVGYSTCHWCHVMEKESFENDEIAEIMNRYFVNIKVDREERPDIDKIYMTFVQSISGHGGWPMSVFLTPALIPIMGGTYFPPVDKFGQPGFKKILLSIAHKWLENKRDLLKSGTKILEILKTSAESKHPSLTGKNPPPKDCGKLCVQQLIRSYDREFGGFSDAPKFPQPINLELLFHMYGRDAKDEMNQECLSMCTHTLTKMANGGIHDHVGQGFARYSVDGKWHVPHFEKMLYDQAQLLRSYANAYIVTKDKFFSDVVDDIVTYCVRDLRHKDGGYYSAEDADSLPTAEATAKQEGAFYVWTMEEIEIHLDKKIPDRDLKLSDIFAYHFNVKEDGNVSQRQDPHGELTNKNVLIVFGSVKDTADKFDFSVEDVEKYLAEAKQILFEARSQRPRPHLDDKIITAWNGLMISGLAYAGVATKNKQYIQYAEDNANFIERYLYDKKNKILLRSCYRGDGDIIMQPQTPIHGFHADYAFVVQGLLDLYEANLNTHWLELAEELQDIQNELFWDDKDGDYNSKVVELLSFFGDTLMRMPIAIPGLCCALLHYWDTTTQIYIAGKRDAKDTEELLSIIRDRLIPAKLIILTDPDDSDSVLIRRNEVVSKMKMQNGRATAYVCRHRTCSLPVVESRQLAELIDEDN
ncbi:Similar to SPATA20: Spermatogenesis-associated protein 20 (Homo sapiens) [Cotesia congregata]|uniref:Similar to SPATA20: Spermatogenesis-associated protein 20 (Homo sapiens) n=1 Tax=Cotesia congregata TaxID=51543 RepID=A0A8J2HMK1_COTCN|nr:Similar to SPATA20: Spermatogenesis-associated protein 20 (Homo sapiens) [Cotesia congregata]